MIPLRCAAIVVLALADLTAQQVPAPVAGDVVPDSYIVLFRSRSSDLDAFRQAIRRRRPAAEVDAIVAELTARMHGDQAGFVRTVAAWGGEVTAQWWIVNGACVTLPAERLGDLRALPDVERVEPNRVVRPILRDATDANHHDTDAANRRTDRNGALLRGEGVSIAILDTGADADMNGTGRPHSAYYPGGDPNNRVGGGVQGSLLVGNYGVSGEGTEDIAGHGTFVTGCAAANDWKAAWSAIDDGPAPAAGVVNVKVSRGTGGGSTTALVASGWQLVATHRARLNIVAGNNSMTGSPSLQDVGQMALDSVAWNADIAITCAAGNDPTTTRGSQSAYNGLAVGSVDKSTLLVSSFSARGPLYGTQRTYPDIACVGNGVFSTGMDTESSYRVGSGTSISAPVMAGILALIRQAGDALDPRFDATSAKAVALCSAGASIDRNAYGIGVAHAVRAVDVANGQHYVRGGVTVASPAWTFGCDLGPGTASIALTWMRAGGAAVPADLDLEVRDATGRVVAADRNPENSYEHVSFTVPQAATYRVGVLLVAPGSHTVVPFCVAGIGPPRLPALAAISHGSVSTYRPPRLVVTGANLARTLWVDIGGQRIADLVSVAADRVEFDLPSPSLIGTHPVTVANAAGSSNALMLQVTGEHPSVLAGPAVALRGGTADVEAWSDRRWLAALFVSPNDTPSRIPGIVDLGIGAAFTSLLPLGVLGCDDRGWARTRIPLPPSAPVGNYFFQLVTFGPAGPTLPLEVSNVVRTLVL